MTAKEMFEKLGYEDITDSRYKDLMIVYKNSGNVYYEISFMKDYKCFEINPYVIWGDTVLQHYFVRLDTKLLQAINKQVEELGWNK